MIQVITCKEEQIHKINLAEYENNYYEIIYLRISYIFHELSC